MIFKRRISFKAPLETIIEELKDGFCTIDTTGNFLYLNRIAYSLLGINGELEKYNFFTDIISKRKYITHIKNTLKREDYLKDYELDIYTANNQKVPILLTLNNIRDPNNKVIAISLLIKDMTYIKRVQQQLLQAQKMESIGMLASGIAHEFNNILTGIIPNAELIKMTTIAEDPNNSRANSIQKSALRAADIVKKLLSFARNEDDESEEITDFIATATETVDILKKLFDKNIEFAVTFPTDLYDVKIDATRLQQILMNLAINAKDAIESSGTITFSAQNRVIEKNEKDIKDLQYGEYVILRIDDTGRGIESDDLPRIFDPFFTTKEPGKGTGLGLSIIYGIIKNIHGKIDVSSSPGKGTSFSIFLPACERKKQQEPYDLSLEVTPKNKTILVVDDEPMVRDMAQDMLNAMGYHVLLAESGSEAIEIYTRRKETVDVVLLDYIMPEMDGLLCFDKLKAIDPQIKVLITSGVGEFQQREKFKARGIMGYLEKPFSLVRMVEAVDKLMNR